MNGPIIALASSASGWHLKCTGWPWWVVFPLAIGGVWALIRLHRLELATVTAELRQRLLLLRGAALTLLLLLLMEPTLARRSSEKVLPLVGVLVDQSGSMAVKDELMAPGAKLAEAIGLDLLPANVRPLKTNAPEQAASDQGVVRSAGQNSAVTRSLDSLAALSRFDRAVKLTQQKVLPALSGKARARVFAMDTGVAPLDLNKPAALLPNRATDFEGCLAALARTWAQDYVGGIILLTDGRQTAGTDPVPVIRSLRARGAILSGFLVGDPGEPPDAVVAELSGSSEVFLGETLPLSARYRITGASNLDWDLVLTQGGKEIERRTVRGDGQWQYENLAFAATNAGINVYQARLELAREQSSDLPITPSGSISLELWNNVSGQNVSDFTEQPASKRPPDTRTSFSQLEYTSRGAQYAARMRGFLIPPQSGNYTFWIASDDGSELWLSPTENPKDKTKIGFVSGFVPRGTWEQQPSQKSQPVTLKARQPYYFETLHKQGSGEDYLAVRWRLPDGTMEQPIPSTRLSDYDEQSLQRLADRRKQTAQLKTNAWKEASVANNSAECSVVVNQDPIRVLLVDSTPRWESRYLAAMFERDRRVHLTRRYHSVIIEDKNLSLLPKDQAEWDTYDMVCLGDLDVNELPPNQQKALANFVARRGGFLVCLAGPRGLPKAFSLGTVANLLPVRVGLPSGREPEPVTVSLTAEGTEHPITQVLHDLSLNQKLWPLLPPLQWVADSVIAKPGATVLLAAQSPARTPVVAVQRYGAGRVFWMGTEESWRWRDRLGERVHQTFWLQVMRWGLTGRLRGQDPRLQVGLDRSMMAPDESAELKARITTRRGEPVKEPPTVQLHKVGPDGKPIDHTGISLEMIPMADAPGLWHLSLSGLDEGTWRVVTTHREPELRSLAEARELLVRNQNGAEGLELGGDLAGLIRMAEAGGLRAGTMDQSEGILRDFVSSLKPRYQDHRETVRLWNNYLAVLVVVALLCAEWVLRKRRGLP